MNVWITETANYGLTYSFEELLDECFMTGSCVFLSVQLMYLGAIYLQSLPCCEYCREKQSSAPELWQSINPSINPSIIFSPCWREVALCGCASQGSVELCSQQILSLLEDINPVVEIVILANPHCLFPEVIHRARLAEQFAFSSVLFFCSFPNFSLILFFFSFCNKTPSTSGVFIKYAFY